MATRAASEDCRSRTFLPSKLSFISLRRGRRSLHSGAMFPVPGRREYCSQGSGTTCVFVTRCSRLRLDCRKVPESREFRDPFALDCDHRQSPRYRGAFPSSTDRAEFTRRFRGLHGRVHGTCTARPPGYGNRGAPTAEVSTDRFRGTLSLRRAPRPAGTTNPAEEGGARDAAKSACRVRWRHRNPNTRLCSPGRPPGRRSSRVSSRRARSAAGRRGSPR